MSPPKKSVDKNTQATTIGIVVAVISFLGVSLTAYINYLSTRTQIELPIQFTQTAIADLSKITSSPTITPSVTPSPVITVPTNTPQVIVPELVFGPINGKIDHTESKIIPKVSSHLWLRNFIVQATFKNPYDVSENAWNYGFGFRGIGPDQNFRLYVSSDSTWTQYLVEEGGNGSHYNILAQGRLNNLDTLNDGFNTIKLIVQNETADFYLNDVFVASLDVSAKNEPGDIYIGTGFESGYMIPGEFTEYQGFTIWELPYNN